jgi:hypothetical protein
MNQLSVIKTFVENKKFIGFLIQSDDGESRYLDLNEFQKLMENKGQKFKVRFPNETFYDDMMLDLNNFEVSNEFEHEYFGFYNNEPIALKK